VLYGQYILDGKLVRHRRRTKRVGLSDRITRISPVPLEAALGDEKVSFIEGCPREWATLPHSPASADGRHRRLLRAAMGRQEGALRSDRRKINGGGWTEPLLRDRPDVG
jgi:hypothetical protein